MNLEHIHPEWHHFLKIESEKPYFKNLTTSLINETKQFQILPSKENRLRVFGLAPSEIKVVIIGQDPYPTPGHANGLCFSVDEKVHPLPKSLINIYKEIKRDYPDYNPSSGDLGHWFNQGVFLINTLLTLRAGEPMSHKGLGWETFTKNAIHHIATTQENVVYLLWGRHAHSYEEIIPKEKNLIIKTSHPSPLGVTKSGNDFAAFQESKQFSQTNHYLHVNNRSQIHW
jgi:uracil-DNA glycosylase